jgi:hypothetical protein
MFVSGINGRSPMPSAGGGTKAGRSHVTGPRDFLICLAGV